MSELNWAEIKQRAEAWINTQANIAPSILAADVLAVLAEHARLVVEVNRLKAFDTLRMQAAAHMIDDAAVLVAKYGCKPSELQYKWRTDPPEKFDYQECMAAVLDALNREGIPAWNGDATGCVVQIVEAQAKRAQATQARVAELELGRTVLESEIADLESRAVPKHKPYEIGKVYKTDKPGPAPYFSESEPE